MFAINRFANIHTHIGYTLIIIWPELDEMQSLNHIKTILQYALILYENLCRLIFVARADNKYYSTTNDRLLF